MKRLAFIMMALLLALMPAAAQNYRDSRYYNKQTGHLDYRYNHNYGSPYYGFRIGPAFTFVNSDDSRLDGGDWQTGLNVGVVAGIPLTDSAPLYLETGLSYIEKGGKKDLPEGKKMTYDLNYLEIPAVLKYKYEVDDHFSIQPQVGGYFAVGVGGKIKNFAEREAESSFKDANFRRLDGGIRIGCGIGYDVLCRPHLRYRSCQHLPRQFRQIAQWSPPTQFRSKLLGARKSPRCSTHQGL